jgi:hypothetical protein
MVIMVGDEHKSNELDLLQVVSEADFGNSHDNQNVGSMNEGACDLPNVHRESRVNVELVYKHIEPEMTCWVHAGALDTADLAVVSLSGRELTRLVNVGSVVNPILIKGSQTHRQLIQDVQPS